MSEHASAQKTVVTVDALQASDYAAWQRLSAGLHSLYEGSIRKPLTSAPGHA